MYAKPDDSGTPMPPSHIQFLGVEHNQPVGTYDDVGSVAKPILLMGFSWGQKNHSLHENHNLNLNLNPNTICSIPHMVVFQHTSPPLFSPPMP